MRSGTSLHCTEDDSSTAPHNPRPRTTRCDVTKRRLRRGPDWRHTLRAASRERGLTVTRTAQHTLGRTRVIASCARQLF